MDKKKELKESYGLKRAQMQLSFGMIFSIILIIVFISFAFFAISKFLGMQRSIVVASFIDDLQKDVDRMWQSAQGSQEKNYILPKKIQYVCFIDFKSRANNKNYIYDELGQVYSESENMFFYPVGSAEGLDSKEIKHIDINKITGMENPFCIENIGGKVKIIIKKGFEDNLVKIIR